MKSEWLKRRWADFKVGHGGYLGYMISLGSFVTLIYTLLVIRLMDNFPILGIIFPTIFHFALPFVLFYPMMASSVGYVHRKKQLWTEQLISAKENLWAIESVKAMYAFFKFQGAENAMAIYERVLIMADVDIEAFNKELEAGVNQNKDV